LATVTAYSVSSYQNGNSGACNCKVGIAPYPTVALSQNYFGAGPNQGAGAGCGKCFHLHLYGDPYSSSWCSDSYDVVVKVADLCPHQGNENWCPLNPGDTNQFGAPVHFDMAENSAAIQAIVSQSGRGAFFAKYCEVDCSQWAGYNDPNAFGTQTSVWGSCPQNNVAGAGTCSIPKQCGGGSPTTTTTGSGGSNNIVWANGVNTWWVAFAAQATTSVTLDCGRGPTTLPYAGWGINGVPVWVWEGTGYQCNPTVTITFNGQSITTNLP